jgi:hypothetical protein
MRYAPHRQQVKAAFSKAGHSNCTHCGPCYPSFVRLLRTARHDSLAPLSSGPSASRCSATPILAAALRSWQLRHSRRSVRMSFQLRLKNIERFRVLICRLVHQHSVRARFVQIGIPCSLQLGVFRPGLPEDRDVTGRVNSPACAVSLQSFERRRRCLGMVSRRCTHCAPYKLNSNRVTSESRPNRN